MKTLEELKEFISEMELEDCLYFSEEETISAIIGFEDAERCLVYDYDKLIESFVEHFRKCDSENKSDEELYETALEWVEYNTIRSLPYKESDFIILNKKGEEVARYTSYNEALKRVQDLPDRHSIIEKNYKKPIIIHNIETYGF